VQNAAKSEKTAAHRADKVRFSKAMATNASVNGTITMFTRIRVNQLSLEN
jgi:hypothetical protein